MSEYHDGADEGEDHLVLALGDVLREDEDRGAELARNRDGVLGVVEELGI